MPTIADHAAHLDDPAPARASTPSRDDVRLVVTLSVAERHGLDRDPEAERAARAIDAGLDVDGAGRLVVWARSHRDATPARIALHHVTATLGWATAAVLIAALIAGAIAAQAALVVDNSSSINIVRLIVGLLGVQSLVLLAWLMFMIVRPRGFPLASIGGGIMTLLRSPFMLGRNRQPLAQAALAVTWRDIASGSSLRWRFGVISNAAWTMFNVGCVAMLVLLLSTQEHRFHWETTILSAKLYATITSALGWLPAELGFLVPSAEQVAATEGTRVEQASLDAARTAWAGLLVGTLVSYALLPRAALAISCLVLLRSRSIATPFADDPAIAAVRERLRPATQRRIVDAEGGADPSPSATNGPRESRPNIAHAGPPAIVAIEPPHPWKRWPPAVDGVTWLDLGIVDDRLARGAVLERLRTVSPAPRCLVVACSLLNTPDRGELSLIAQLRSAADVRSLVLLSDGQALRERSPTNPNTVQSRIELWRDTLARSGISPEEIIELDLEHLTSRSGSFLAARIAPETQQDGQSAAPRLNEAFALIAREIRDHGASPSPESHTTLMRSIAALYRSQSTLLSRWLGAATTFDAKNLHERMRDGATKIAGVLPTRLGLDPRWLAAGAAAGALGCLAVATVATPVALGMLPVWTALGAAVSAAIRATTRRDPIPADDRPNIADWTQMVRSAALFAVILELQGHDEATITRVLDSAFDASTDAGLDAPDDAERWLAILRHRVALAMAEVLGQ